MPAPVQPPEARSTPQQVQNASVRPPGTLGKPVPSGREHARRGETSPRTIIQRQCTEINVSARLQPKARPRQAGAEAYAGLAPEPDAIQATTASRCCSHRALPATGIAKSAGSVPPVAGKRASAASRHPPGAAPRQTAAPGVFHHSIGWRRETSGETRLAPRGRASRSGQPTGRRRRASQCQSAMTKDETDTPP